MENTTTDQNILWRIPQQAVTFHGEYHNRPGYFMEDSRLGHFMEDTIPDQDILWRIL